MNEPRWAVTCLEVAFLLFILIMGLTIFLNLKYWKKENLVGRVGKPTVLAFYGFMGYVILSEPDVGTLVLTFKKLAVMLLFLMLGVYMNKWRKELIKEFRDGIRFIRVKLGSSAKRISDYLLRSSEEK